MGRQGSALFTSSLLCLCVLAGTVAMASAAFAINTNSKSIANGSKDLQSTSTSQQQVRLHKNVGLFSSCLPFKSSSSSTQRREPSIFERQWRRLTVFRVAFQVFVDYKWAGRKAKGLKKTLGLNPDDPDSDDHPDVQALWSRVHDSTAQQLLRQIKNLEGFWVKVGQYLSSRADVMPPEYLQTLGELQDSMPPRSWDDTWQTIQEELGEEGLSRLESIDPEPLSTASLAQVHRAILKPCYNNTTGDSDSGSSRDVVLKVQHRGVAALMLQDMDNLRVILNLLAKTDPDLDFGPVISEYNQEVKKELDFRTEAQNMKEISSLLKDSKIEVIIPETIPGLITERVLVMDFCEGFAVRDTEKLDEYNVDRELLLERVCAAWAVQMHVGGVFNADPHMGNILVSTAAPGDASVPVLLDFGLTKRLDPKMKVAFARLMHSSYESDVDSLLQSFDEMGLKMNRHDPFEDLANMQRGFGDTVPQSQVREVAKRKSQDYERRMEAKRAEAGVQKGQKLRSPVEAWPSELVFFGRVSAMLRGMCSRLDVSYPYLRTMAMAARETLRSSVPQEEHAIDVVHPSAAMISTPLQHSLVEALDQINSEGHMVGLQICVLKHGQEIANIAAGALGTANPRPVTPSTLFNIFSVSKGVLTIGLLCLVQDGRIESLDDPVAKYWPAFESKPAVTVRHLLTHQSGLANVYPEDATLDTLLDWSTMTRFIAEEAVSSHEPGEETQYHALSFAWLVGGLIESVTGSPYEEWFDAILPCSSHKKLRRDLFLAGISNDVDNHQDLAVLSVDRSRIEQRKDPGAEQGKQQPTLKKEGKASGSPGAEEGDDRRQKKAKKVLDKYRGLQQLMNPSVFNMRKVREAKLPSANGHASAAALAEVFDALIRSSSDGTPLLSTTLLELARTPSRTSRENPNSGETKQAMLDDAQAKFGLGFQLHEFTLANGEKGTSIVSCVPLPKKSNLLNMAASSADDLTIYTGTTPNGKKVILAAEELGLQYTPKLVNTSEREQFEADFVAINPNSKFPAIVDKRSGEEIKVWESAAILIHLAEVAKSDLLPTAPAARADVMKWTIFQAANIGPNCGNLFHFATQKKMGPEDYPIQRYGGEVQRLFNVMDKQLASNAYLAGDAYSLADVISFHWVQGFFTFLPAMLPAIGEAYDFADESKYTNLRAWVAKVAERPAVKKTAEVYEAAPFKKAE